MATPPSSGETGARDGQTSRSIQPLPHVPFGTMLRRYRRERGLTQEDLAERAGLSLRSIGDMERGVPHAPRTDTLARLAEALAVSAAERVQFEAAARRQRHPTATLVYSRPSNDNSGVASLHHSLDQLPTSFIGREREMAAVRELLLNPEVRLVTLTGPGGIGKTRLAMRAAADLHDTFPDGAVAVWLAPLRDPALALPTIAQTLGVKESGGQTFEAALLAFLHPRRLLLVLDNVEHILEGLVRLPPLLASCPGFTVLATSRSVLRLSGEHDVPVPPLTLPDSHQPATVDYVTQSEAVRLFVARGQAVSPSFTLTTATAPVVAAICEHLDGLPLALELAAARLRLLSPQGLLARLDHRLTLLTSGPRDLPARQQTLRNTLAWSIDLLSAEEQTLFAWLSVFVGGFTLEAAEDVCARVGGPHADVLDGLNSLLEKSLLLRKDTPAGEPRFTILETLREYGQERLVQSGAMAEVRAAHAHYFLMLAEEAEPHLTGTDQEGWLARLEAEHDNLRAVLRWSYESDAQWEVGLRLAGAVWRLWAVRGYLSEGRYWLEGLSSLAEAEARETCGEAAAARAKVCTGAGNLAWQQADYVRARALHTESLALLRVLGDRKGIAASLSNLGIVANMQGDYAHATALYEESLALRRDVGDREGIAASLNLLGNVAREHGHYTRASLLYEESLALRREVGDKRAIATSLNNLGIVATKQGDYVRATTLYKKSLALHRQLGDRWGIGHSLNNLGIVAVEQGDTARATALLQETLTLRLELGDKEGLAWTLEGLARVTRACGTRPEGRAHGARLLGAATALRAAIGAPLPPSGHEDYATTAAVLRAALGAAAYEAAWAEGLPLTLDEAVALAREEAPSA